MDQFLTDGLALCGWMTPVKCRPGMSLVRWVSIRILRLIPFQAVAVAKLVIPRGGGAAGEHGGGVYLNAAGFLSRLSAWV